jgi:hypothetical protein
MMPSFAEFASQARAAGFDEVIERRWGPLTVVPTHTHDFDVEALVAQGEFQLACEGRTRLLRQGERFALARGVPHEERYGPEGATFWVARRRPAA